MTQTWPGRLTDGETAGSTPVRVSLDDRGVILHVGDRQDDLVWPYGAITSEPPLGRGAREALLTYRHMPGASVFVQDAAFVEAIRKRAPGITTGAQRRRWVRPILVGILVIALAYGVMLAINLKPVRGIASLIPETVRVSLGAQLATAFTTRHGKCVSPDGVAALNTMVARLLEKRPEDARRINVSVLDWNIVNAFAGPGGYIFLTKGLILKATAPEDVVGVLAHEVGHARALHPETNVVRSLGIAAVFDLMVGGGGSSLTNIATLVMQRSYAREDEREADRIALELLKSASISQRGLQRFFANAAKSRRSSATAVFDVISTHPEPAERMRAVAETPDYPTRPTLSDRDWIRLRAICGTTSKAP
ncbi:MAG: M48 family metallopeptidase [Pseudomonadota bacterium]